MRSSKELMNEINKRKPVYIIRKQMRRLAIVGFGLSALLITMISHRQLLRLLRLRLMRRMILKTASSRAMQRRLLLQSSRASSVLSRQEMMMTQLQIRSKARSRSVLRMIPRATIMQRNIMRTERMQQKLRSRTKSPTR